MSTNYPYRSKHKELVKTDEKFKLDLKCSDCGNTILGNDININNSLAKCANCGSVYKINDDHFFLKDRADRPEMIMPKGTDVLLLNDTLDIRINWLKSQSSGAVGFLTFFAVMWNGILAIIASSMMASGASSSMLGLVIHAAIGLGLIYYLSRIYLNYTDIVVTEDEIQIIERPLPNPFRSSKSILVNEIDQIYVTKYVSSTTNDVPNYAYALYAITKNGKKISLIREMNRETQLYLEQEIERKIGIIDKPIAGAIR